MPRTNLEGSKGESRRQVRPLAIVPSEPAQQLAAKATPTWRDDQAPQTTDPEHGTAKQGRPTRTSTSPSLSAAPPDITPHRQSRPNSEYFTTRPDSRRAYSSKRLLGSADYQRHWPKTSGQTGPSARRASCGRASYTSRCPGARDQFARNRTSHQMHPDLPDRQRREFEGERSVHFIPPTSGDGAPGRRMEEGQFEIWCRSRHALTRGSSEKVQCASVHDHPCVDDQAGPLWGQRLHAARSAGGNPPGAPPTNGHDPQAPVEGTTRVGNGEGTVFYESATAWCSDRGPNSPVRAGQKAARLRPT